MGATFELDYVSYLLVTLAILLVCVLLMRPRPLPSQEKSSKKPEQKPDIATKRVVQQELQHVPTPWGWPGHHGAASSRQSTVPDVEEVHGVSESMHHFVDRLFSEKHTVDSREYLLRKDANLRALIEDRYGRAGRMKDMTFEKVRPTQLRDPVAPRDQMGNKELRTPWGW